MYIYKGKRLEVPDELIEEYENALKLKVKDSLIGSYIYADLGINTEDKNAVADLSCDAITRVVCSSLEKDIRDYKQ